MYRLLKQALKNNPIEIRQKQDSLFANQAYRLPGNQNYDDVKADTDQTRGFAHLSLWKNLSRRKLDDYARTVQCGFGSNN